MTRALTFSAGLAVVIATGVVYGAWTQRWRKSAELETRAAKLRDLPDDVGRWKSTPAEIEPEALSMAGAEGWWARQFTDERTGTRLLVILLCGRPGPISVHRPETCYGAAGYGLVAPPVRYTPRLGAGTSPPAEFWAGDYRQAEVGGQELRIFYSWYGDGAWRAPDNPRWTFARLPALYKLYIIREMDGTGERLDDDPAVGFLRDLLPLLSRTLSES